MVSYSASDSILLSHAQGALGPDKRTRSACVKVYETPWSSNIYPHGRRDLPFSRKDLPKGYSLAVFPGDAKLFSIDDLHLADRIPYNYNIFKTMVALGQTLYTATTLYRSKGDQLSRFGYAAFGLTVGP
jgi:hypothetical protein